MLIACLVRIIGKRWRGCRAAIAIEFEADLHADPTPRRAAIAIELEADLHADPTPRMRCSGVLANPEFLQLRI